MEVINSASKINIILHKRKAIVISTYKNRRNVCFLFIEENLFKGYMIVYIADYCRQERRIVFITIE